MANKRIQSLKSLNFNHIVDSYSASNSFDAKDSWHQNADCTPRCNTSNDSITETSEDRCSILYSNHFKKRKGELDL